MQMRNVLFSVVLCSTVPLAAAECPDHPLHAAAPLQAQAGKLALADDAKEAGGPKKLGDMLIKSADASQPPGQVQPVSMQRPAAAEPRPDEERQPRTTTAMLLTALAVMFAIALRRAGAQD